MARPEATPTRWAADPERIDPDDYPALTPFVKLISWTRCPTCQLQVHTPVTRLLLQGLDCPNCGTQLLPPPEDGTDRLALALRREDEFSEQID